MTRRKIRARVTPLILEPLQSNMGVTEEAIMGMTTAQFRANLIMRRDSARMISEALDDATRKYPSDTVLEWNHVYYMGQYHAYSKILNQLSDVDE